MDGKDCESLALSVMQCVKQSQCRARKKSKPLWFINQSLNHWFAKNRHFARLETCLPLTGGRGEVPLATIAEALGMTEAAVKMAASRLRRRYGELLREEIARTVADPADVESEVAALFAALGRRN